MAELGQVLTRVDNSGSQVLNGGQTQTGQTTQAQTPFYTDTQLGMRGQANNLMQQLLTGQTDQFGLPQASWDAANANFDKRTAPGLAAIHGSGSPTIAAAQQDLNVQLAGLSGQMQTQNGLNAYHAAAQYAFQPTGFNNSANQNTNMNQNQNTSTNSTQTNTDVGSILGTILGGAAPLFGS
jgi:hypothetical protein